ncbi:MAG: hypothetical protein L6Q71_08885 [Planctomycetes bacterium]|nr:hypothetical protein [Planctomycetota bacterium]NUQ34850.1 hypothetical protein [Planctomycetaceae bacterium]
MPQDAGAADGEIRFETPCIESSLDGVSIVLFADDKTKTSYINKKLAEEIKAKGWECVIFHEIDEAATDSALEEDGEDECGECDSVFKERNGNMRKEFDLQPGDFLVVDGSMNDYGKTRTIGGISAIANKVEKEALKREAKQQGLLDKAKDAVEKNDRKAAVRELEKIAKAGHRGSAWESAWELYDELIRDGLEELDEAIEAGDQAKLQEVGNTYGIAFGKRVKKELAALRAVGVKAGK